MPIPINEVTGTIAVVVILGAYVFRKQFWNAITNRGGGDQSKPDDNKPSSN